MAFNGKRTESELPPLWWLSVAITQVEHFPTLMYIMCEFPLFEWFCACVFVHAHSYVSVFVCVCVCKCFWIASFSLELLMENLSCVKMTTSSLAARTRTHAHTHMHIDAHTQSPSHVLTHSLAPCRSHKATTHLGNHYGNQRPPQWAKDTNRGREVEGERIERYDKRARGWGG